MQINVYIKYPNGTSSSVNSWLKPKIREGSIIFINQKGLASKDEVSGWQIFATVSSQASSLAATLLTLSILMNQGSSGN